MDAHITDILTHITDILTHITAKIAVFNQKSCNNKNLFVILHRF